VHRADHSSRGVLQFSSQCDSEAPSWETMARNKVESTRKRGVGGWGALVQKPRVIKQEETGTDS